GRRSAFGRRRLVTAGGTRRAGEHRAVAHVLDRLRRALLRRARRSAARRRALRDAAPRARPPPERSTAAPGARRRVRRTVCRFVSPSDLPRLEACGGGREGRTFRRGRRRALRRLLHLRRRSPRCARRAPCAPRAAARRAVAELRREGVVRLPGETIRSRGPFAAPRATPRVGGDLR